MIQLTPTVQNHLHYDLQERSDIISFRALRDSPLLDNVSSKSRIRLQAKFRHKQVHCGQRDPPVRPVMKSQKNDMHSIVNCYTKCNCGSLAVDKAPTKTYARYLKTMATENQKNANVERKYSVVCNVDDQECEGHARKGSGVVTRNSSTER